MLGGPALWMLSTATYGAGDVVTTHLHMQDPGLEEANPVVDEMYEDGFERYGEGTKEAYYHGSGALVAGKARELGIAFVLYYAGRKTVEYWSGDEEDEIGPMLKFLPATITVLGAVVTLWNAANMTVSSKSKQRYADEAGVDVETVNRVLEGEDMSIYDLRSMGSGTRKTLIRNYA